MEINKQEPFTWLLLVDGAILVAEQEGPAPWIFDQRLNGKLFVACLSGRDHAVMRGELDSPLLVRNLNAELIFLIQRREPPELGYRQDGEVNSFICTLDILRRFAHSSGDVAHYSAYDIGFGVLNAEMKSIRLSCLQVPLIDVQVDPMPQKADWIIPHCGHLAHLETCLSSMRNAVGPQDRVAVCFDEKIGSQHVQTMAHFREFSFFASIPPGNGPYVAREYLAAASTADVLFFQDSDDCSCVGRRNLLLARLERDGLDLVGSHELRIDEIEKRIIALRYPLDVSHSLAVMPRYPLLFPASVIRRQALWKSGGFSTHRKFASDTEFLLRAYFFLKIGNVDEFLYIRRRHPHALTVSADTALGSPERLALDKMWAMDFYNIKLGRIPLFRSSLVRVQRPDLASIQIVPLAYVKIA